MSGNYVQLMFRVLSGKFFFTLLCLLSYLFIPFERFKYGCCDFLFFFCFEGLSCVSGSAMRD